MLFSLKALIVLIFTFTVCSCALNISPSFLFVDEDWTLLKPLPVTICPTGPNLRIISGDPQNTLQLTNLNDTCATIKLRKHLDADIENVDGSRWQSFSLVIENNDERESLEIQVVDVNDNTPIFQSLPTTFNISEKSPIGTTIGVVKVFDPDTGIGGVSRFFIEDDHFNADRSKCAKFYCTSTIRLAKMLDFEEKSKYNIIVVAQDGAGRTRKSNEARLPLKINVIDEQDMAPKFLDPTVNEIIIAEEIDLDVKIYQVQAEDGDKFAYPKHEIIYSINTNEYLKIDAIYGWIAIKKSLDYELLPEFKVTVKATEDSEEGMFTEKEYTVIVKDFDDERPKCEKDSYQFEIEEGASKFTKSARIYVYDRDQGKNAAFIASIEGDYAELFEIAPAYITGSSNLSLSLMERTLDFETTEQINLTLSLIPEENSNNSGHCTILIDIIDLNDNSPEFINHSSEIHIKENSPPSAVGTFQATDKDSNKFLPVVYRLSGNDSNSFSIDKNGILSSKKSFDREIIDTYNIIIEAIDDFGRGNKADFNLTIIITDENDNAPEFNSNEHNVTLDEESEINLAVKAKDKDLGSNGKIKYSLINNTYKEISVDENSGIISFNKLDAEHIEHLEFSIIVRATDSGEERLYSEAIVHVKIHDINDNPPTFTNSFVSVNVDRHFVGHITQMETFDLDRTSANNKITYEFSEDIDYLQIDNETGKIQLLSLPINKSEFLDINVIAKDNGIPELQNTAKLFIRFKDRKEIAFEQPFVRLDIWENITSRSLIYNPKIVNPRPHLKYKIDGDMNITWTKEKGINKKYLRIDSESGGIYIVHEIDGDIIDAIDLIISVRDTHDMVLDRAYIKVVINDINDNYPVFEKSDYTTMVQENLPIGHELIKVKANDADKSDELRYSLVLLNGTDGLLVVDNDGSIKIANNIDYELVNELNLTVLAQDMAGHVAAANMTVFISDMNDNMPEFLPSPVYDILVEETAPVGTILNLSYPLARDLDSGKYGIIKYILLNGNEEFMINDSTSVISLRTQLDFEKQKVHSLTVKAIDNVNGRGISNEAFASVNVRVIDVNDNAPRFVPNETVVFRILANEAVGSVITKIVATDDDIGMNGEVSLKLKQESDVFDINKDGVLRIKSSLKDKVGKKICIDVVATDMSDKPLSNENKICVLVAPDGAQKGTPIVTYPEDNSIHHFYENKVYDGLLTLNVIHNKSAGNPTFQFTEVPNQDWKAFQIDENGTIRSKRIFDFEEQKLYELKVEICYSHLCTFLTVFIAVNDINDNCPEFKEKEYVFFVKENEVVGANGLLIGSFEMAVDADGSNKHRNICYELEKSNEFFLKDVHSNHVFLTHSLDRERISNFRLKVTAYDCNDFCNDTRNNIQNHTYIVVNVLDVNDNFPRFTRRVYHGGVIQGRTRPSEKILTVNAVDPDLEEKGLHYQIKDLKIDDKVIMPNESPVKIDSITGEIFSSTYFRMDKSNSFNFHVVVQDGVGHEDEALVTISTIGYDQQLELIFENISINNEKMKEEIQSLLSEATNSTAVIDGVVPSFNSSVVMVHFLDKENAFIPSNRALSALDKSDNIMQKQARTILQNIYGLRHADHVQISYIFTSLTEQIGLYVYGATAVILLILLIIVVVHWRQKSSYSRKLRAVTAANYIRTVRSSFLPGTNLHAKEPNPLWKQLRISNENLHIPAKSDLQSTEL